MATNPYTSQSTSGYNASPPPDDGTESEANRVTWAKIKTKLADVLKTFGENIDSQALAAFAKVINTDADENNAMAGSLALTSNELTISSGSVTATRSHHTIDTESDAASDDLDTIATGSVSDNCVLVIRAANTARTVVCKHEATGAGQLHLADDADYSLDDDEKFLVLMRVGADWYEVARSNLLAATQAQQETGTATTVAVTPGRQQYHQSAAKAWTSFTAAAADSASYNVSSITDNAAGDWSPQWNTDFSSANYSALCDQERGTVSGRFTLFASTAAASAQILSLTTADAKDESNTSMVFAAAYGDQ